MSLRNRVEKLEKQINPPKHITHLIHSHEGEDPEQALDTYRKTHVIQDNDLIIHVRYVTPKIRE